MSARRGDVGVVSRPAKDGGTWTFYVRPWLYSLFVVLLLANALLWSVVGLIAGIRALS